MVKRKASTRARSKSKNSNTQNQQNVVPPNAQQTNQKKQSDTASNHIPPHQDYPKNHNTSNDFYPVANYQTPFRIELEEKKKKKWFRLELMHIIEIIGIAVAIGVLLQNGSLIRQTKEQFYLTNLPYLQIKNIRIQDFDKNQKFTVSYLLENIGSYPVQITKRSLFTFLSSNSEVGDTIFDYMNKILPPEIDKINKTSEYLSRSSTDTFYFFHHIPLNEFYYEDILTGNTQIYFGGDVYYYNLITEKECRYRFLVVFNDRLFYRFLFNDNIETDKSPKT